MKSFAADHPLHPKSKVRSSKQLGSVKQASLNSSDVLRFTTVPIVWPLDATYVDAVDCIAIALIIILFVPYASVILGALGFVASHKPAVTSMKACSSSKWLSISKRSWNSARDCQSIEPNRSIMFINGGLPLGLIWSMVINVYRSVSFTKIMVIKGWSISTILVADQWLSLISWDSNGKSSAASLIQVAKVESSPPRQRNGSVVQHQNGCPNIQRHHVCKSGVSRLLQSSSCDATWTRL